jgi:integrase/recombinase XerD
MPRMSQNPKVLRLILDREIDEFLLDRKARSLTKKTLLYYQHALSLWREFLASQGVQTTGEVTPTHIRLFLVQLEEQGKGEGGRHNVYGALRTFLYWYGEEYAAEGWKNPIQDKRVIEPKRPEEQLEPVSLEEFQQLLEACKGNRLVDDRDRAMLLILLDTGIRKSELVDLRLGDVDLRTNEVSIKRGKGRKPRTVVFGTATKKALRAYIKRLPRAGADAPLWVSQTGDKLTHQGTREALRRRAVRAGLSEVGFHRFRYAFAINYLRNGGDLATLQRLLGHKSLKVMERYLKLITEDLRIAHSKASPVDNLLGNT